MKKLMLFVLVIMCSIFCLSPIEAKETKQDPISKLGRGITNIATGWMEILYHMKESGDEKDSWAIYLLSRKAPCEAFKEQLPELLT